MIARGALRDNHHNTVVHRFHKGTYCFFHSIHRFYRGFRVSARAGEEATKRAANAGDGARATRSRDGGVDADLELTESERPHIFMRLCAEGGAPRRNIEAHVPTECSQTCEDPWFSCSYGLARWTRGTCRSPSQGAQNTQRVVVHRQRGEASWTRSSPRTRLTRSSVSRRRPLIPCSWCLSFVPRPDTARGVG
jgi:hypothetical protein